MLGVFILLFLWRTCSGNRAKNSAYALLTTVTPPSYALVVVRRFGRLNILKNPLMSKPDRGFFFSGLGD